MWYKACLTICIPLTVFSTSPVMAALLPDSCVFERAGDDFNGHVVEGENLFVVGVGCGAVHKFKIDLLNGGVRANMFSRRQDWTLSHNPLGVALYSGIARPEIAADGIGFSGGGAWYCEFAWCASSGGRSDLPIGIHSASGAPHPVVLWLFMAILWLVAIALREWLEKLDPVTQGAPARGVQAGG